MYNDYGKSIGGKRQIGGPFVPNLGKKKKKKKEKKKKKNFSNREA